MQWVPHFLPEDVPAKSKALLDMDQHFLRPIHNTFDIKVQLYNHVWTQCSHPTYPIHPMYPMPQYTPLDIL